MWSILQKFWRENLYLIISLRKDLLGEELA